MVLGFSEDLGGHSCPGSCPFCDGPSRSPCLLVCFVVAVQLNLAQLRSARLNLCPFFPFFPFFFFRMFDSCYPFLLGVGQITVHRGVIKYFRTTKHSLSSQCPSRLDTSSHNSVAFEASKEAKLPDHIDCRHQPTPTSPVLLLSPIGMSVSPRPQLPHRATFAERRSLRL